MPQIKPDWEPSIHAYDLIYARVHKAEENAKIPINSRLSKGQIKVMMEGETPKMRLYFLTTYQKGKLISRSNWDLSWVNWMERHYEKARHNRSGNGSQCFKAFSDLTNQEAPKPVQKLKYKVPVRVDTGERLSTEAALEQLKKLRL